MALKSLDELLKKDKEREKDGFPKKIKIGKFVKPTKGGDKNKIIIIPTVVEEKFIHDDRARSKDFLDEEGRESSGSGEGNVGDVIYEKSIYEDDEGDENGVGSEEGGEHDIASDAYDLGKILTEKFELPNIKDKGKKKIFSRYVYDFTNMNRGSGQFLDKKATLKEIVKTNIGLENISSSNITPENLLFVPRDKVYKTLAKEKEYDSRALVFFMRDYSGSMMGGPASLIVSQHIMIYSWLIYQYKERVDLRFILHDMKAKEVPDFHTYYKTGSGGGTDIATGFKKINEIVRDERLSNDYNIYVFYGTDGEDGNKGGEETKKEIEQMFKYVNRIGVTIIAGKNSSSTMEEYIKTSDFLYKNQELIRFYKMEENSDEDEIIKCVKYLIS